MLVQLGRYEEAAPLLLAALADLEKTYGAAHPSSPLHSSILPNVNGHRADSTMP